MGTPTRSAPPAVAPSWRDLVFPEERTQRLLETTNTLLAQLVAAQGLSPRTAGLALPPVRQRGVTATPGAPPAASAPVLTQSVSAGGLAAAVLGAGAQAYVQYLFISAPLLVPPATTQTYRYSVPADQVLILLDPLTASTDLHSPTVEVTLTVDNTPVLVNRRMTQNVVVLLAADAVVRQSVAVAYTNNDTDALEATTDITGVLVDLATFVDVVSPLLNQVYGRLQTPAPASTEAAS